MLLKICHGLRGLSVFNFVPFFLANKNKLSASPELNKILNLEPQAELIPFIFLTEVSSSSTQERTTGRETDPFMTSIWCDANYPKNLYAV